LDEITEALNIVEVSSLDTIEIMPGVVDQLKCLRRNGIKIGIATRSCQEYAEKSLDITKLSRFIDVMLARDQVEYPKPDERHLLEVIASIGTSPEKVVYIGDTITDLLSSRDANITFIGFSGNESSKQRMMDLGANYLINSLDELPMILRSLKSNA
jgi:phosphoglycolate phosphatase